MIFALVPGAEEVIVYDPQMKTQKKKLHFNSNIYAIAEDNEGTVWMGSRGEVFALVINGIPTKIRECFIHQQ